MGLTNGKETAVIFDTEVAGMERKEVVQLAYLVIDHGDDAIITKGECQSRLFKPENEWEAGAVAVHGIIPDDVECCPPSSEAKAFLPASDYLIAHNVDFDCEAIGGYDGKRICTLALARYYWPEFACHKLGALAYELFGMTPETRAMVTRAHDAASDIRLLERILGLILSREMITDIDHLWMLSENARIPTVMPFGKHKGTPINDVPADYARWLLSQDRVDPYLVKALQPIA